jgi:hypothetical protein
MQLSFEPMKNSPPPADRTYTLTLVDVPLGVSGAPEVGTTWPIDPYKTTIIDVPTYYTNNGLKAYEFSVTMSAVPEPASLVGLLLVALLRRRP